MSNITNVNHLFVPLRYLQFLKIIRSTAAAAENEASKVWRSGPVTLVYNICTKVSKYKYCTTIVQYFSPGRGRRSGAVSFDELMETIPKGREPQTKEEAQNNHRDRIKAALPKNSSRFMRTIISVKEDLVEKSESSL